MCPSIGVFWVPQHIYDDYIHDCGIYYELLGELTGTKIVVHGLFRLTTHLKILLIVLITFFLVLIPSLRMILLEMLCVVIILKRILEVLDIHHLLALVSDLHLPPKMHTEQTFARCHYLHIICTSLYQSNILLGSMVIL